MSHSVVVTRVTFKGLSASEFLKTQAAMSKIPFLWAEELLKDGTYIATLCIPVQENFTTFDYLDSQVPNLGEKAQVGYVSPRDAYLFTIPYNMFERKWKFDLNRLRSDFFGRKFEKIRTEAPAA